MNRNLPSLTLLIMSALFWIHQSALVHAQVVYVSTDNGVYQYLERISLKSIIKLDDEIKPYSRIYTAEKLSEINLHRDQLNKVEHDELDFYMQEYKFEIEKIAVNEISSNSEKIQKRWFLYSYEDSLFNLKLSPIAGYGVSSFGSSSGHTRWVGASIFWTYSDWLGISFNIRDKGEFGENVDKNKYFSPASGAWFKNAPNGIEYSDLRGGISFNWNWGSISLLKESSEWGHGKFGQLILSSKPPSFPQIKLSLKPTDWFRFTYIHGWLNSQIKDSSYMYYSYPGTISQILVENYIPKYVAANMLTVSPVRWLDISAGNAIVYAGELRPEFFIPFMFYKFLDHNTGRGNVNDGNGTMFLDVSAKYPQNFQFYSTLFVDVTEIRNILSHDYENTWVGFTAGVKTVDAYFDNLDITVEYTRINPWVYEHKDEVTNYKHIKYYLGHWLGQNADQIRLQIDYQLLRGLKFKAFVERVRKGGLDEIYYAYKGIDEKDLPFLYSPLRKDNRAGLEATYEFIHDLIVKGTYSYSEINDSDLQRTPKFMLGSKNSFSLSLYYGL